MSPIGFIQFAGKLNPIPEEKEIQFDGKDWSKLPMHKRCMDKEREREKERRRVRVRERGRESEK